MNNKRNVNNHKMVTNTMDNNPKTIRVHDTRYRTIPGFTNYGISSYGEVINLLTKQVIRPKDLDHWTGRYTLYTTRGNRRIAKTFNAETLLRMTYSDAWVDSVCSNN